jgi:hypothetical protein
MDIISTIFDSYNRKARLYPALLTLAPIIWSGYVFGPTIAPDFPRIVAALTLISSFLYVFANAARSHGKILEKQLVDSWGAWPTTILLRHRDNTIDIVTKARYHAALSIICDGMPFPTPLEEQQSPEKADIHYHSAIKRLIERRLGPQYEILNYENASYGFRRNLLGLKPFGLVISFMAAAFTSFAWWAVTMPEEASIPSAIASFKNDPTFLILIILDIIYFLLWVFKIRKKFVFQAAREYSRALLKTLDMSESK